MDADRFYRRMLKIAKEKSSEEERLDRIRDAFVEGLPPLPGEMGIDLFWEIADLLDMRSTLQEQRPREAIRSFTCRFQKYVDPLLPNFIEKVGHCTGIMQLFVVLEAPIPLLIIAIEPGRKYTADGIDTVVPVH